MVQARNRRRLNIRNRVGGKSLNYWSTGVMGQGLLRGLWWWGDGWGKVDNTRHKCHSDNLIVPARGPALEILQALLSNIEYMASKSKPNYFDKHETLFSLFSTKRVVQGIYTVSTTFIRENKFGIFYKQVIFIWQSLLQFLDSTNITIWETL